MTRKPPGASFAFALPAILPASLLPTAVPPPELVLPVLPCAGVTAAVEIAWVLAFLVPGAILLLAELLAIVGTSTEVALERHSRSRVLALADLEGTRKRTMRLLEHVPTYEVTARLMRFLGNAVLMIGLAFVTLRGSLGPGGLESGDIPWGRLGGVLLLLFGLVFLINDVLVRLVVFRRPNKILLSSLGLLDVMRFVLAPVRYPLVLLVRALFRVNLDAPAPSPREEILETVEEGEREGSFTPEEADMIESIIEMDTTVVRDVLTPRVDMVMLQADAPLTDAVSVVNEDGCSRIPVYEKDRDDVVGVLYARDLLEHWNGDPGAGAVRDVMRKPFFVPENKPLNDLMKEMRGRKVHLAVVLDEFNGTSGLVTIEDLLEEIVGEIEDEYDDTEEPGTQEIEAGKFRIEGRTPIEEVNEHLSVNLPIDADFETLAGLVFHSLGRVPAEGEEVRIGTVIVKVLEADERTARTLEVEVLRTETA